MVTMKRVPESEESDPTLPGVPDDPCSEGEDAGRVTSSLAPVDIEDDSREEAYLTALVETGQASFFPGYGPGQEYHEVRWVLWCYRYDYESKGLAWLRTRTGFPESLAGRVLERISARWPVMPDAYDRPLASGRTMEKPLGVPWPVYLVQRATATDPAHVPSSDLMIKV
jgi:hypothetical protein